MPIWSRNLFILKVHVSKIPDEGSGADSNVAVPSHSPSPPYSFQPTMPYMTPSFPSNLVPYPHPEMQYTPPVYPTSRFSQQSLDLMRLLSQSVPSMMFPHVSNSSPIFPYGVSPLIPPSHVPQPQSYPLPAVQLPPPPTVPVSPPQNLSSFDSQKLSQGPGWCWLLPTQKEQK